MLQESSCITGYRTQFIKDAGFQYYIISRCGVSIGRIYIVIHGDDEDDPFVPVDVTDKAKGYPNVKSFRYRGVKNIVPVPNRPQRTGGDLGTERLKMQCLYLTSCNEPEEN